MKEKELQILNASLKLFVENGFHGTSTAKIAKSAGVATGTLFHYFKTKEELINRLYLYAKESMLGEISGHYNIEKSFKENIKYLWISLVDFGIKKPEMFQFILSFHCSPYITSLTKEEIENRLEMALESYTVGLKKQEIKNISYELIVDFLWGSIVSTVDHIEKYPEKAVDKIKEQAFDLFWDGISQ
ncbi:MAG: TetR/AcrR family transcriptional regulator [Methanobacteriaceae archaeon]|nr:TetR/AcrR family transcriptional regulator [Methanobacteriaceae archaeon]MDP2837005.1 TetR/AcrR family transcriptional regulator [Methanobacteriaceae archaeon]MDP3034823.1 TetR/AcrR family transcriptional regulator [Methanobacteriaceae archaeon]MDP3485803.1 TetR/AcrR family transcriptional regulator [Methanobacteriaceae archaeon]MDP3624446.1 TetR/AcrR family transcriptional regulator [Methanobacteriaceae archaeon]